MTVSEAYLRQARSDFAVFVRLRAMDRAAAPECHPLHYLQMATEKLAKAVLLASQRTFDRFSHVAFSDLPDVLTRRNVAAVLGYRNFKAYRQFLRRSAPIFRAIEQLSPASAGASGREGPNTEYPWPGRGIDGMENWLAPADHRFGLLQEFHHSGDAAPVYEFVHLLLDRFEVVFR